MILQDVSRASHSNSLFLYYGVWLDADPVRFVLLAMPLDSSILSFN